MHVPHLDALDGRHAPPAFLSPPGYTGHAHFRERALSRRRFVQTAAGAAMVVGAGLWLPASAAAAPPGTGQPKPIPGGTDLLALLGLGSGPTYHFFFPAFGQEVSTVGDLNGFVAAAEIQGSGTATDTASGATSTLTYDADVRFMDGVYVGQDGRTRRGTFGFI